MMHGQPLIGRDHELSQLHHVFGDTINNRGVLVLLAGEAGIGKTRLVEEACRTSDVLVLRGHATQYVESPYGPLVAAFRSYLRRPDAAPIDIGVLTPHLALLLPELGHPSPNSDRSTLFEAIRQAFVTIARGQPILVFLDDLQWADSTTIELLPLLAAWIEDEPIAIIGAYRSDEIPRGHPLRRMRTELRRAGRFREISIESLGPEETALLAAQALEHMPGPALRATIYDRTQGIPFFIEELTTALVERGQITLGPTGVELSTNTRIPVPETIRDAILLRTERLSSHAQQVLAVASALGLEFDLDLVTEIAGGDAGLAQPFERGLVVETAPGRASFRHDLAREAIYDELPWPQRRTLHRQIAARLEVRGVPSAEVAEHWLLARDFPRACRALIAAAEASRLVHAYRDAARAYRHALDIWPEPGDEPARIDALTRLAQCAELCGDLPGAARIWQVNDCQAHTYHHPGTVPR
jgi:predicted ATPase